MACPASVTSAPWAGMHDRVKTTNSAAGCPTSPGGQMLTSQDELRVPSQAVGAQLALGSRLPNVLFGAWTVRSNW
jgi:hypothetical protein